MVSKEWELSKVVEIHIALTRESPMQKVISAELEAGKGIVGDRYHSETGTYSQKLAGLPDKELTLLESEKIDEFNAENGFGFNYGDFRRNIVTEGVSLNALVGKEFTIGDIRLQGIRLCEPCAYLSKVLVPEIMACLVHKCGLRAEILDSGAIQEGDALAISVSGVR